MFAEFNGPEQYGAEMVIDMAEAAAAEDAPEGNWAMVDEGDRFTVHFHLDPDAEFDETMAELYSEAEIVFRITVAGDTREYRVSAYDALVNGVDVAEMYLKRRLRVVWG